MSLAAESPAPQFQSGTPSPLAVHRDPPATATRDVVLPRPIEPPTTKRVRLASLDVFRGMTIALMVLVNNSPDGQYSMLDHAQWHGWTPTDLVFPFFLFIVGVAIPFSLSRRGETATRGELLGHIWIRALALIMLGFTLRAIAVPAPWLHLPPDGFVFTKAFRWAGFGLAWVGTFALLVPWPWKRISTWLPVVSALIFVLYCVAMHFIRLRALAAGWPQADFDGGRVAANGISPGVIFNPDMMRIPGVLQRIGICYGVAATIGLFAGWRVVLLSALAVCTLYIVLMFKVPVEGHKLGSLAMDDNFARTVDVRVLDRTHLDADGHTVYTQKHTYSNYPDNEGFVSTLPSIATALCGILAGFWLRSPRSAAERCAGLLAMAGPVILLGIVLDHALMPINKNLWTPSFTVFCAGMALLVFGTVFYVCDVLGRRLWAWPFTVMGMNAIAAFVASGVVVQAVKFISVPDRETDWTTGVVIVKHVSPLTWLDNHIVDALHRSADRVSSAPWIQAHAPSLGHFATTQNESLLCALAFVLVIFLLMSFLYACRIFVKV